MIVEGTKNPNDPDDEKDVITALAINPLTGAVTSPLGVALATGSPAGAAYAPGWMGSGHEPGLFSGGKQFYGAQPPGPIGRGPGNWVWDGWGGSWRSDWVSQDPSGRWLVSGEN